MRVRKAPRGRKEANHSRSLSAPGFRCPRWPGVAVRVRWLFPLLLILFLFHFVNVTQ